MKFPLPLLALPLSALAQGVLTDNFDATTGTAYRTAPAPAPGAVIGTNDVWAGNFLRLTTDGVNSQANRFTYPLLVSGAYDSITAEFDFRAIDGAFNQAADGFHFGLVPTATHPAGDGPNLTAEEPNAAGYFAVAVDLHPADGAGAVNDISAHWNGFEQVNHRAPTNRVHFINQRFHHAKVELNRVGNSSLARVTVTPNVSGTPGAPWVAFEQIMPLLLPYENRVQFAGRTGGRDVSIDLDNLNVSWDQPHTASLSNAGATRLLQDFDRLGTTPFTASQFSGSWTDFYRPGVLPIDSGSARGVFARLVHDPVNTSRNSITFHHTGPSLDSARRTSLDFRMASAGNSADGMGLLFLRTSELGRAGAGVDHTGIERPSRANTLAVGFDLYDRVNDVSVHYGTERLNVTVNPAVVDLNSGVWHHADIDTVSAPGGMNVSVTLTPDIDGIPGTPVPVIVNQFVAGVSPYEWRVQVGARTGGAFMSVDVDNLVESPAPPGPQPQYTRQDFSGGLTHYEVWRHTDPTSGTNRTEILSQAAPNGEFLRLITAGNQNSRYALGLDRSPDAALPAAGTMTLAEFAFRAAPPSGSTDPADGLGFLLIPTATAGITGPGVTRTGAIGVEEPNYPGVLAVGVDLYQASAGVNDVSVHWDGGERQNARLNPATQVDLDANVFHHAKLLVRWGAATSTVDLVITPDVYGTPGAPVVAVSNLVINGLAPYDYRVEVAARSGGSTSTIDVDDILARTVATNSYTAWINGFASVKPGQRAEALDADGDGLSNLLEYFAALSPTAAEPPSTVLAALDGTPAGHRFTFRRAPHAPDATLSYEWSTDLATWHPADAQHVFSEEVIGGDASHQVVRATLASSLGEPTLYARLKITAQ